MKALSFYQPIAWMLAHGHFVVDDRTWIPYYRGPIAIHASKTGLEEYIHYCRQIAGVDVPDMVDLERGGIVGVGELVDVLRPGESGGFPLEKRAYSGPGHYGLVFANVVPVAFIPCRGRPGLFDLDFDPRTYQAPKVIAPQRNLFD